MGARAKKVYLVRDVRSGLLEVFLPHPTLSGCYVKQAPHAIVKNCDRCGAKPLEPCTNEKGDVSTLTHGSRRVRRGEEKRAAQVAYRRQGVLQSIAIDLTGDTFSVTLVTEDSE